MMADDTTRGVHLNAKQLVFVLMAVGVFCSVTFLFGVLVGRGVQAERGPGAEGTMIGAPQVVPDPQPADGAGPKPAGPPLDDFSYPKRLSQPEGPAEALKAPATVAASPPVAAAPGRPAAADAPPDGPADSPTASRANATSAGGFTVQVVAVPNRGDADVIAKRLKAGGYEARVVAPEAGDRTGRFRVKVGTYKTRREADAVARKIESEGRYKPWVTR